MYCSKRNGLYEFIKITRIISPEDSDLSCDVSEELEEMGLLHCAPGVTVYVGGEDLLCFLQSGTRIDLES